LYAWKYILKKLREKEEIETINAESVDKPISYWYVRIP
jgi:hypothetical protein